MRRSSTYNVPGVAVAGVVDVVLLDCLLALLVQLHYSPAPPSPSPSPSPSKPWKARRKGARQLAGVALHGTITGEAVEEVVPALVAELPELVLLLLRPRLDGLHVDEDARLRVLLDCATPLPETHAPTRNKKK